MAALHALPASWGYGALFLLGLLEFGGVPVGAIAILLATGALASDGALGFTGAVVATAAGGLAADLGWLSLARWRGDRIVDVACGLSANPASCVLSVRARVARFGAPYIVAAKFVPGTAALVAAAAGMAGFRAGRFAMLDGFALVSWASLWLGLGWKFADRIGAVLQWIAPRWHAALVIILVVLSLLLLLRVAKARLHRARHYAATDPGAGLGTES